MHVGGMVKVVKAVMESWPSLFLVEELGLSTGPSRDQAACRRRPLCVDALCGEVGQSHLLPSGGRCFVFCDEWSVCAE